MLVLTRKLQEKIRIGDDITITILRTKGKAVRLGIEAPGNVPVIRGELTFDTETVDAPADEVAATSATESSASSVEVVRSTMPSARKSPDWTLKSDPVGADRRLPGALPHVSLERVSREQLAKSLPGLAAGESPLRSMLKRRTLSA